MPSLTIGSRGDAVRALQQALIDQGFNLGTADGSFGAKTADAVRQFQLRNGLKADGKVGPMTAEKLGLGDSFDTGGGTVSQPQRVQGDSFRGSGDLVAQIDNQPSGTGMAKGSITLNGRTYRFNSGGSSKYSTPKGTYIVRSHSEAYRYNRGGSYNRNGVGFSFCIEDANRSGSDKMYDGRAGRDRTYLRIHPDGGNDGTEGCIGLVGSAAELKQFRDDLNRALDANGGRLSLTVN